MLEGTQLSSLPVGARNRYSPMPICLAFCSAASAAAFAASSESAGSCLVAAIVR